MHNTVTDRRWATFHYTTPPATKLEILTTLFSLRYESAAEHHTAEQYFKTDKTIFRKKSQKRRLIDHEILARTFS